MQKRNDFDLNIAHKIRDFLREKIKDIGIGKVTETDDGEMIFDMTFVIYNYFVITMKYDRGLIQFIIKQPEDMYIPLTDVAFYSDENLEESLRKLCEEAELRIPDKYLAKYGWL